MKAMKERAEHSDIFMLPKNTVNRRNYLDATQALDLAILGATAFRMVPIERLFQTVWALTGVEWKPPVELISSALRSLIEMNHITEKDSWIQSVPFLYSLTNKGAEEFQVLIRKPLLATGDPFSRSSAEIKYGLFDVIENEDLQLVAGDLCRFFTDMRSSLEQRTDALRNNRPFLCAAVSDQIVWIDRRLRAIDTFVRGRTNCDMSR